EIRDIMESVSKKSFFIKADDNPMIVTLIRSIFEEMQHKGEYYRECVRGIVYSLLFEIARFNGRGTGQSIGKNISLQLQSAIEYVEKNYPNNFKIADLANECHMSETHFRRIFQEKMNMTPVEYVNFVRVKKACELIDKTDISMEDVAEKVGFVTPSTFNRNFRRIIGTSPYQWKKRPDNHEGKLLEYKISALKGW
ncbi:MAG: AraC family transcriptional regulator, partial [Lachnospiraceae bacterium]|nr:AraC family transcriptional regulator [Lachnospiraceae bacterium]